MCTLSIPHNARSFNNALKKTIKEKTGIDAKVQIINSYKYPHCWIRVYAPDGQIFPNELRLHCFDVTVDRHGGSRTGLHDENDVQYGNIRTTTISMYGVEGWVKVFEKFNQPVNQ